MNILKYSKENPVNSECRDVYIEYNENTKCLTVYAVETNIYETEYDFVKYLEFRKVLDIYPEDKRYLIVYDIYISKQELFKTCLDILLEIINKKEY